MTSPASHVVPFRFAALEQLTHADVATAARMRHVARELVDLRALEVALGELIGARIVLQLGRFRRLDVGDREGERSGLVRRRGGGVAVATEE